MYDPLQYMFIKGENREEVDDKRSNFGRKQEE